MAERTFEENQKKYAEVIMKLGANIQPGQRVLIWTWVECAEFANILTEAAYQAGASYVDIVWDDEAMHLTRFKNAPEDSFGLYSDWRSKAIEEAGERGDAFIRMIPPDPSLLIEQEPKLVKDFQQAQYKVMAPYLQLVRNRGVNWVGANVPTKGWAAKVLPDLAEEERIQKLWDLIFKMSRISTTDDPVAEWERHIAQLQARSKFFNEKKFSALKYNSPGTELYVGLPPKQLWMSAQMTSKYGVPSVVNIPTEETFTAPSRTQVNGTVHSTKPLNVRGMMFIDDFSLTFKNGKVVEATAKVGEEHLHNLLESDPNARYLGEVALVPHSSPISQSGVVFYNTLYDENASCHLALGSAYRFSLEGGENMSEEEFDAAGGNSSVIHTDFMIGSKHLDIDGLTTEGKIEPVMRGGEWAFEVDVD